MASELMRFKTTKAQVQPVALPKYFLSIVHFCFFMYTSCTCTNIRHVYNMYITCTCIYMAVGPTMHVSLPLVDNESVTTGLLRHSVRHHVNLNKQLHHVVSFEFPPSLPPSLTHSLTHMYVYTYVPVL